MVASRAVMPSTGPAFDSGPTSMTRSPIERPSSVTTVLASTSAPHISRSHSIACSASASSWAAMWWKAATTFASGRSAWTSSAEEPAGGGVNSRGPPKVSGTTVLTTTLPRHAARAGGSVVARPVAGSATTTTSPSAAASAFSLPTMASFFVRSRISTAFSCARAGSREPMMIEWPTIAQRMARPEPSLPVPPSIAMFIWSGVRVLGYSRGWPVLDAAGLRSTASSDAGGLRSTASSGAAGLRSTASSECAWHRHVRLLLPEQIARGVAQEALAAAAVVGREGEAAHDGGGHAVELAHHRLGGRGELVGEGENRRLQRPPRRIALAEIALERREAGHADGDVGEALAPWPAKGVGDDDADVAAGGRGESLAQRARRAVGVLGQERDAVGVDVGLVHPRIRAHPAVMRLGHEHAAIHADHAARLAQDPLDQPRVPAEPGGHGDGDR